MLGTYWGTKVGINLGLKRLAQPQTQPHIVTQPLFFLELKTASP